MTESSPEIFSRRWVNLASAKLGATALSCSDDFFAPMHRMLKDEPPVFIEGKYDDNGKWMDGWESRRKRTIGHDWCVVKLAKPGIIHGIEIDTTHFTGNYPPAASIDACFCEGDEPDKSARWVELIPQSVLDGDSQHQYPVTGSDTYTHVRINLYPDGGIARLRVYAEPKVNWEKIPAGELVDIAAALNGGVALACNNEHFGTMGNLLTPGRGINMGDGWETRRRREPGNDWVVIALARAGVVRRIEVDTAFFKGNFPDRCSIQGAHLDLVNLNSIESDSEAWQDLLPQVKLGPDREHEFTSEIIDIGSVTHIRLNIYPDGGVSRLRLFAELS
jgi:allantoicase